MPMRWEGVSFYCLHGAGLWFAYVGVLGVSQTNECPAKCFSRYMKRSLEKKAQG